MIMSTHLPLSTKKAMNETGSAKKIYTSLFCLVCLPFEINPSNGTNHNTPTSHSYPLVQINTTTVSPDFRL